MRCMVDKFTYSERIKEHEIDFWNGMMYYKDLNIKKGGEAYSYATEKL